MDDVTPSAALIPAQPVATETNPAAPFPPADSSPVFVPPSVTDPVSNLDFLPVDDAFTLEMRSESIEQLVGGDALRRGESERIEARRSQTNADLVAGRDRVRVQGTLHEHTGHARAEQAAHLHTTVDGTLDVHAGSEDTVLLAGHMSDLWDGGTAIVAAMTDDTVAGGGIRVTTPLDLWVHGLMGVEERIGTCTADAVLMELGAMHYEREYGPGVHAAGLAVYTGSLYQSSRSTFRPLMRVSSGVRNLIAGGGGGGAGGDAGAGDAPDASPAPAPAAGDMGTEAASETLCAATDAGGTAQAGVMAGVRSEDLTGIQWVDDLAALARPGNVAEACVNPTGLRRGEDTAGQLEALRDAMRGDETGAEGEVTSISRVPELDDTASVHEASALDIVGNIGSQATVPGMDAPVSPSTVSPPRPPPGVKIGLLGGADRPPPLVGSASTYLRVNTRLHDLRRRYVRFRNLAMAEAVEGALERISDRVLYQFERFGGTPEELARSQGHSTTTNRAYFALWKRIGEATCDNNIARATEIRKALDALGMGAIAEYQWLAATCNLVEFPPTLAWLRPPMQRPPETGGSPVTAASQSVALAGRLDIPGPAHHIAPDVTLGFPQPAGGLVHATDVSGPPPASSLPGPSLSEAGDLGRARLDPPATTAGQPTATGAIVAPTLAGPSSFWLQPANPWPTPGTVPVDSGLHHAGETLQPGALGRARLDPPATVATAAEPVATEANVTSALAGSSSFRLQPANPPPEGTVPVDSGLHHAGEAVQPLPVAATASSTAPAPVPALPTGAGAVGPRPVAFDPWFAPPGPSSQVASTETLPPRVMTTGAPPGWQGAEAPGFGRAAPVAVELPLSRREVIAFKMGNEHRLRHAVHALTTGRANGLGGSGARVWEVIADLYRLNAFVFWHTTVDAAMLDVDWSAIDALIRILDARPPSP